MGKGFTKEQTLQAISNSGGIVTTVQQRLGCKSWETAKRYIEKWSDTREAWETENSHTDDLAQSVLIKDIQNGNVQSAKWWLERRRRKEFYISHYGTAEQQETDDAEDNELTIEIVDGDDED